MDGLVPAAGQSDAAQWPLPGGRQRASGTGRADGGAFGPIGGGEPAGGLGFEQPVEPGGYAWWYVDAISDDGRQALTIIAFIGSVFSPYYRRARRQGGGEPLDHVALNVALYLPRGKRWTMTERGQGALVRTPSWLQIGPSRLTLDAGVLSIDIDERTMPLPGRVRGTVRVRPTAFNTRQFVLNEAGGHRWWPIAPRAEVEVAFERPAMRWSGHGYLDSNRGDRPPERDFARWQWARGNAGRDTFVVYDTEGHDGARSDLALRFDARGTPATFAPPPAHSLPPTGWRIGRSMRGDAGGDVRVARTLEDTPFYARSLVETRLLGEKLTAVHESLSLERFVNPWVQAMLPFRMPRRG